MIKEAENIIIQEKKKNRNLLLFFFLCAGVMAGLTVMGYGILAVVFAYVPIRGVREHKKKQELRFETLLGGKCKSQEMEQVAIWYYTHAKGNRGKEKWIRRAARACIYNEKWEEAEKWIGKMEPIPAAYEQLFFAFYQEREETFNQLWENYLLLAGDLQENTKEYQWYHQSFVTLDIYRSYMDNPKKFFQEDKKLEKTFTQAEQVVFLYKKACLLLENPKEAEKIFYSVMDKGGTMMCVKNAKEKLQQMFLSQ